MTLFPNVVVKPRTSLVVVVGVFVLLTTAVRHVSGFHPQQPPTLSHVSSSKVVTFSTITTTDDDNNNNVIVDVDYQNDAVGTTAMKRSTVISIAHELRNKYGYYLNPLVVPRNQQMELLDAIMELEDDAADASTTMKSTTRDTVLALLPGDWDLICTMAVLPPPQQEQRSIPSLLENEFLQNLFPSTLPIASLTNKFVTVTQKIKCTSETDGNTINRVDNVIEVKPPSQVSDLLDVGFSSSSNSNNEGTPSWLKELNINPLEVKETKVILIHTAEIVNDDNDNENTNNNSNNNNSKLKLRLKLQSVVNNIAGTGGNFDPNGADVLSLNVPQLDTILFNPNNNDNNKNDYNKWNDALGGSFITTYIDTEYRISRSDLPFSLLNNLGTGGGDTNSKNQKSQQIRIFRKRRSTTPTTATTVNDNNDDDDDDIADVDDIQIEAPSDVEE